jgi:hypothetical protein
MPAFDNYSENPPAVSYAQGTVSVGATATLVASITNTDGGVLVQNNTGSPITVYLGGSTVTTTGATAGYALAQNTSVLVPTIAGVSLQLYAIAASTASVSYLYAPQ